MARRYSAGHSYSAFFSAGALAAHAATAQDGFRLRDAVFFINLMSNWCEYFIGAHVLGVTNVQAQRFLDSLVRAGLAARRRRERRPRYFLTGNGVVELVRKFDSHDQEARFDQFLFKFFFLKSYGTRLQSLVNEMGTKLPRGAEVELEYLCRADLLRLKQERWLKERIKVLEQRIASAKEIATCLGSNPSDAQLEQVSRKYPYQLSHEKPLEEVLTMFGPNGRKWELMTGAKTRTNYLWQPSLALLREQLRITQKLEDDDGSIH